MQMGTQHREWQQRGYLVREVLEDVKLQFDELDCLREPELVIHLVQVQWCNLGNPHPVACWWHMLHSCSKGELQRRDTQGNSLIKSGKLSWEKTSWKVASASLAICACLILCFLANVIHQSSYLWANPCISWANSHSSWNLAWLSCKFLRAWWKPNPSSIWVPSSWWGWRADKVTDSTIWSERQCSSSYLCHKASQR